MDHATPTTPRLRASQISAAVAELGESPLWDREIGLRWLDIPGRRFFTLGLDGSETTVELSATATAVELGPDRQLLAVTSTGFGWLDPESGHVDEALTVIRDDAVTMNDAGIDPRGRCWAGSAGRDGGQRGAMYCLDDARITTHLRELGMSNGIAWSPDGDQLYHVDSTAGTNTAWEYSPESGTLGAYRVLRSVPADVGLPDGLTVDTDGDIWLAVWGIGQVWRLDADSGEITAMVDVPTPYPTSCVIGGAEMTTLYITTARHNDPPGGGLLYAVEIKARGRHSHVFTVSLN